MKIFYTATSRIPSTAANSVHVMRMCQAFQAQGYDTSLLVPGETRLSPEDIRDLYAKYGVAGDFRLDPVYVGRGKGKFLRYLAGFFARARRERPDFVYGRSIFGLWAASRLGIPFAYEMHSPVSSYPWIERMLFASMIRSPWYQGTVVISEALRKLVVKDAPQLAAHPILVAHDGADLPSPTIVPANIGDGFKLGYVGSLYPGRGIDIILKIAEAIPDASVHIVGGTEEEIRFWKDRSPSGNVIFHGYVNPSRTQEYQLAMDVLLAPYQKKVQIAGSRGDTSAYMSPLKIFEYMASGKSIVCSDMPVLREVLDEDCACLVSDFENPGPWIDAVKSLRDESTRERLGKNAFTRLERHYTWNARAGIIAKNFLAK